jgi:beta-lactam-binding protein with PASTA domain
VRCLTSFFFFTLFFSIGGFIFFGSYETARQRLLPKFAELTAVDAAAKVEISTR